jgi:predicted nucleotidyltransferase
LYKFFDKYNLGAPFIYIHPYKQLAAKKIADNAPENLDYIIIFGSAVTPACYCESDIDVCLIGRDADKIKTRPMRTEGQAYDFLSYTSLESFLALKRNDKFNVESRILEDGVIIYERENLVT